MRNVLCNAPSQLALPADDGLELELGSQTTGKKQRDYDMVESKKKRKISPQQTRYKNAGINYLSNVTSISDLKNEVNRTILALSMRFSAVGCELELNESSQRIS